MTWSMVSERGQPVPVLTDAGCHTSARWRPRGAVPWWLWDTPSPCCRANTAEAGTPTHDEYDTGRLVRFAMCLRCRTPLQDGLLDSIFEGVPRG